MGAASATAMDFDITFADKPGQTGTQFLFEIGTEVSADGAYPKSKGFNTGAASGTVLGPWPRQRRRRVRVFRRLPWPRVRGAGGACLSMCMTHDTYMYSV